MTLAPYHILWYGHLRNDSRVSPMGNFTQRLLHVPRNALRAENARAAMDHLLALDLHQTPPGDIRGMLQTAFTGYQVEARRLQPGIHLFRGRACDKPGNISAMLYPPPDRTPLGRVNQPGKPVLYCCASREAPFFELRPSVGTTVAIAQWATTAPMLVNHAGYTRSTFERMGSVRREAHNFQKSPHPSIDDEITETLAEIFTRSSPQTGDHLYHLTSMVADFLFGDEMFDGLLYPTVAMRANSDNIALKPRYADRHLRFLKAEYIRVDEVGGFNYKISVLDTASSIDESGAILWKGRGPAWVMKNAGEQLMFTVENGAWVARDMAGRIVEPD